MATQAVARPRSGRGGLRPRARRMAPEKRRAQLVRCALEAFAEKGLAGANLADVARVAGVSLPTVCHYFSTKETLLDEVLGEVTRFLLGEIVAPYFETDVPVPESIERILLTFCDAIDSHPHHVRVWLEWSVSIRDGLWSHYQGFYRAALDSIERVLARGADEGSLAPGLEGGDAARVIVGLAHMIVQMRFSGSDRDQVRHTVRSLVGGYLQYHV